MLFTPIVQSVLFDLQAKLSVNPLLAFLFLDFISDHSNLSPSSLLKTLKTIKKVIITSRHSRSWIKSKSLSGVRSALDS